MTFVANLQEIVLIQFEGRLKSKIVTFRSCHRINHTKSILTTVTGLMTERQYNECVDLHADHVFRFIVKNLRHEEDSRDIVQTSFEKLWVNRDRIDPERSKSYLFTIAYHQMIDHIRKNKKVELREPALHNHPVTHQPQAQMQQILHEALQRLSDTQRSLVLLKDYEGYSYEEIAEITSLNLSQVKVYLHRARIQLKNWLVKPENVI